VFDSATDILSGLGEFLSPDDFAYAQELFEGSFVPGFIEADYTWIDVRGEDFFDFLGLPEQLFDWEAWREEYEAG